ncbi:MAG: bifunctional oligoribonuclease/PAP phosphatase NrnA [Spirochaetales bacterium]|nr:MAG: bifunctional oligoribonuclease/PAP phosphatase NrnA [Spirochaetales bacterium]
MIFDKAVRFLDGGDRFILTVHETPDGDAVGSQAAMGRALAKLGKRVLMMNADPIPQKFRFLDRENNIQVLESENQIPEDVRDYRLLIMDTNDINNIGQIRDSVIPRVRDYFIIDHHEQQENIQTEDLIIRDASSTCEILYDLFAEMSLPLDREIAAALYVGIVYDTGSFIYPKTTAKTFLIAHSLVLQGINPNEIYSRIYESNSISSLILQSRVMSTLELHFDNHVAIQTMGKKTVIACGASYEEADAFINIPLKSEDVLVSIFFKENMEGIMRCSLRSKGNINVAEIAQEFSGGGHKTAAGFKCRDSVEETKKTILNRLSKYFAKVS